MTNSPIAGRPRYIPWSRYLIVVLLVLGIFFRFYNLDRKNYWNDEVYTALRVSGYTKAEMIEQVTNRAIPSSNLQKYQRFTPEKDWGDVLNSLIEDARPPLGNDVWQFRLGHTKFLCPLQSAGVSLPLLALPGTV